MVASPTEDRYYSVLTLFHIRFSPATNSWDVHPETRPKSPTTDRGSWNNKLQFILTCLGCAVGLGNIWRFPSRAYENGGSAFLIPYLVCGFFFGLPVVYGEFFIGQYTGVASVKAFKRYAPAFQGVSLSFTGPKQKHYRSRLGYGRPGDLHQYILYSNLDLERGLHCLRGKRSELSVERMYQQVEQRQ